VKRVDGTTVAGWSGRTPAADRSLDPSTLDPAETGTEPSYEVTALGIAEDDAAMITGAPTFSSDAPALCVRLTVVKDCPVLAPGVSTDPVVAVERSTVAGRTVSTVDGTDTTAPLTVGVTRGAMSGCLDGVGGTVVRGFTGGTSPPGPAALAGDGHRGRPRLGVGVEQPRPLTATAP
jgi:hypothetical protein